MLKKSIVFLLVLTLLLTITACTIKQGGGAEGDTTGKQQQEIIDLTVELFDRANVPADQGTLEENRWTNWIKEEMLKQGIRIKFYPVPRGEEVSKLNILMSAGDAPDLIFTYNRFLFIEYATKGGLHDLTQHLKQYGPEIIKVSSEKNTLPYGVIDGKQYAIPAIRSYVNHKCEFIRKDWLDKLGLPIPTNRGELEAALKAFKEKDPGGIGSDKVIPWGNIGVASSIETYEFWLFNAMYSFMEHSIELNYKYPWPMRPGFKEFMSWMNKLYKEGLIDPEFATTISTEAYKQIATGVVGFFTDLWSVPFRPDRGDIYRNLAENVPDAVLEPIEVFRNDDGKYYKDQYAPVGLYHMSPTTCKHLKAVIKYLNWLATKEPAWTLSWGIESEHYRLVNGAPVPIDVEHNKNTLTYINLDLNLMFAGGDHYPLPPEVSRELIKHTYGELGETAAKAHDTAGKDAIPQLLFDKTLEVQSKYAPELNNTFKEYWVKLIINEDFESTWQEFMKEFKEKGIDEVINERIEYYNTYVKK